MKLIYLGLRPTGEDFFLHLIGLKRLYVVLILHHSHSPVFRASAVAEELQNIADEQGTNVEKLVGLVKENQEILDMMKVSFITSNIGIPLIRSMTYQTSPLLHCW